MYQFDLKYFEDILQCLKNLSLKHNRSSTLRLLPLDIKIVDEYCNFINALIQCRKVAEDEYSQIIREMTDITALKDNVLTLKSQISDVVTVDDIQLGEDADSQKECATALKVTIELFSGEFIKTIEEITRHINKEVDELKKFKIVLFGRTKVGKSTVREALTQGSGESIGKGGQSTTIQIHEYNWYNLQVYDTPGILSSKDTNVDESGIGDEERMANELLMRSDIALFMFASDNIEQPELEYLQKIAQSGKEVLILLNVKSDISDYRMYKMRKKEKDLSPEAQAGHINRITEAVGNSLEILPIHAQAAFFSRARDNQEIDAFFKKYGIGKEELYELSRFGAIRNFLVKNILDHGIKIRCKTLWDYFITQIRDFAGQNRIPIESCKNKVLRVQKCISQTDKKIQKLKTRYIQELPERVLNLARECIDTYDYAYDCIEYGRSKDAIRTGWENKLEDLNEIPEIVIHELLDDIQNIVKDLNENIGFELSTENQFDGYEIQTDLRDFFKVSGLLAGGVATTLTCLAALNIWNPGGWIIGGFAGLGILFSWIGGIIKSKTSKIRELQKKLDKSLESCSSALAEHLTQCLNDTIFNTIHQKMEFMKQAQKDMLKINDKFLKLNDSLLNQADKHEQYLAQRIKDFS
ncbi:MAG: GTPase domain-containing protein [Victivallaceae bacterium]|nr:GTPase domain-containing protein [Victivallaceae bacterium]